MTRLDIVFGPGTWLIFGVILVPLYAMLTAWILGEPKDTKSILLGVGYLVGFTALLWGQLLVLTLLIGLIFFDLADVILIGLPAF